MDSKIKFGLYAGALIVLSYLCAYFIEKIYYFNYSLSLITLVINIVFMVWAVNVRKHNDGNSITFQIALGTAFVVPVISHLIFIVFDYIFQSFIDPQMIEVAKAATVDALDSSMSMMEKFGVSLDENQHAEVYGTIDTIDFNPKIGNSILSYFQKIIGSFIIAVIVSLIMKNK